MKNITLSVVFALLVASGSVSAQVLMFNFGNTAVPGGEATNSPYHTENSGFTGSTWNELGKSDSASLKYADNTDATGVAFDIGRSEPQNSGATVSYSVEPLSSSMLEDKGGVYSLVTMRSTVWTGNDNTLDNWVAGQVTGLAAGTYEVFIWGNNGNVDLGDQRLASYVVAGSAAPTYDFSSVTGSAITNASNASWSDGVSYSKTIVTLTSGQSLFFAVDGTQLPSFDRGFLSGVQVAAVPEPSTYALAFGALIGILAIYRRRR